MRYIWLSIDLTKQAIQNKNHLEALAFNVLIKKEYVSSSVHNATVRGCRERFGFGMNKMSRILRNGQAYGLLRIDKSPSGKILVATKIRSNGYNIRLDFEDREYRLSEIIDMIRNSVLLNHIKVQNLVTDTLKSAENPSSMKMQRWAKKKLKRMAVDPKKRMPDGLSNARIAEITNSNLYRAKILIRKLVDSGKVIMEEVVKPTGIKHDYYYKDFEKWRKKTGGFGYLFWRKEKDEYGRTIGYELCARTANRYIYNCDAIKKFI